MKYSARDENGMGTSSNRRIRLFSTGSECHVGVGVIERLRRQRLRPTDLALDFAAIAFSALTADNDMARARSADGWTREIELSVAVSDPDLWREEIPALTSALEFLTTDRWELDFVARRASYPRSDLLPHDADSVCLLSGGLDSLLGALELGRSSTRTVFVSQVARGDRDRQVRYARLANPNSTHLQVSPSPKTVGEERSQRSRSLSFLAAGALAASALNVRADGGTVPLAIPENGYIAINPPLTPSRVGSLSTRTAHPTTLGRIQSVLDSVPLGVQIQNPFSLLTKGEMMRAEAEHRGDLRALASDTTSCGKFLHYGYTHCGRCVPCQVRRAAFLAAGIQDDTQYRFQDRSTSGAAFSDYADVRDVTLAVLNRRTTTIERWAGSSLVSPFITDARPYLAMLDRGIGELEALHLDLGLL